MSHRRVVLATASYDHTIKFWEAQSACHLAAACNPHIRIFDINSNNPQPVTNYLSQNNNVTAIGFERDGRWIYSGSQGGAIKIWDFRTPRNIFDKEICTEYFRKEYESDYAVNTVVLHPNQTELISGDENGAIRVWDLRADACSRELVPEVGTPIRSLSVKWDGTMMVAANNRGTCYIWRLTCGLQNITEFEPFHKLQAHDSHILKCLLSPQNKYLATASSDKTIKIWNVDDDFKLERVLTGHQRWVWDCAFSLDGEFLVTASSDTTARLWSMQAGREEKVYQGHHRATVCCALSD
ncbi:unnamed protein product [Cochlearia groenlandica]